MIGTSDFVDGLISGPITLDNYGLNTFVKTLSISGGNEGIEKFYVNLRTGSNTGPIVASSSLISVSENSEPIELYPFTTFTFTNGTATGALGPSSFDSVSSYTSQSWYSTYFSVSGGIQYWTAPVSGNYTIRAAGASSGLFSNTYYRGIIIQSTIALIKGQQYKILVGQSGTGYLTGGIYYAFGGGGGTFMTTSSNTPIIVAGGGGGPTQASNLGSSNSDASSGTSGNSGSASGGTGGNGGSAGVYGGGGGGFYSDGQAATTGDYYGGKGRAFVNGGAGGVENIGAIGGFGGGGSGWGSTNQGGGGGGGYSGGGSGATTGSQGGGGGSYSQTTISVIGYNRGNGYLTITKN
jgi:tripartite motif-containing protein 56